MDFIEATKQKKRGEKKTKQPKQQQQFKPVTTIGVSGCAIKQTKLQQQRATAKTMKMTYGDHFVQYKFYKCVSFHVIDQSF